MFSWVYYSSLKDHVDGWLGGALLNDGHLHQVVHLHAAPQLRHRLHLNDPVSNLCIYWLIDGITYILPTVLWIRIRIRSGFNRVSGSGSRRAKWPTNIEKKLINYIFWNAGCSLPRAEGFSCCLDISKLHFFFKSVFIFFSFWSSKPWTRFGFGYGSGFTWNAGSGFVSGPGFNESGCIALLVHISDN